MKKLKLLACLSFILIPNLCLADEGKQHNITKKIKRKLEKIGNLASNQNYFIYLGLTGNANNQKSHILENGYNAKSDKASNNIGINTGVGMQINNNILLKADVLYNLDSHLSSDIKLTDNSPFKSFSKVKSTGMLCNVNYLVNNNDLSPYLFAGAGFMVNNLDNIDSYFLNNNAMQESDRNIGHSAMSFSWDLGLGLSYKLLNNFELDLNVKHINLGKAKTSQYNYLFNPAQLTSSEHKRKAFSLSTNQLMLGVKVKL